MDYFPLIEIYYSKQKVKEIKSINFYKIIIYEEGEAKNEFNFIANRNPINIYYDNYIITIIDMDNKTAKPTLHSILSGIKRVKE